MGAQKRDAFIMMNKRIASYFMLSVVVAYLLNENKSILIRLRLLKSES